MIGCTNVLGSFGNVFSIELIIIFYENQRSKSHDYYIFSNNYCVHFGIISADYKKYKSFKNR